MGTAPLYRAVGSGKTFAAAVLFRATQRLPLGFRADDLLLGMVFGRFNGVRVEQRTLLGDREFKTPEWDSVCCPHCGCELPRTG